MMDGVVRKKVGAVLRKHGGTVPREDEEVVMDLVSADIIRLGVDAVMEVIRESVAQMTEEKTQSISSATIGHHSKSDAELFALLTVLGETYASLRGYLCNHHHGGFQIGLGRVLENLQRSDFGDIWKHQPSLAKVYSFTQGWLRTAGEDTPLIL